LTQSSDPQKQPGVEQQTYIDPGRYYAEVVRVLADVVDPGDKSIPVAGVNCDLSVTEIANPVYDDNALLGRRRLLYDGQLGSTNLSADGNLGGHPVSLQNSQAVFELASVAEAKWDGTQAEIPLITTLPYSTQITAVGRSTGQSTVAAPSASEALVVSQWVDEGVYLKNRENSRTPPDQPWGAVNPAAPCPDWLEMKTLDYCISATASQGSEEDRVFGQIQSVGLDFLDPKLQQSEAGVYPSLPRRLVWASPLRDFRFPLNGRSALRGYYGLQEEFFPYQHFGDVVSHESRHAWQIRIKLVEPTLTDNDGDGLPANVIGSSPELLDAPYLALAPEGQVGNPEFNFQGDCLADTGSPHLAAMERNAIRFAAQAAQTLETCGQFEAPVVLFEPVTNTVSARFRFQAVQPGWQTGWRSLEGASVLMETAPAGTDPGGSSGWTTIGYYHTDNNGALSIPSPGAGVARATLVPPIECSTTLVRGWVFIQ